MSAPLAVVVSVVVFVACCVVIGSAAALVPRRWLEVDSLVTRIRPFERNGRLYERVGIRRWKGRLPESNSLGGANRSSKRSLTGRSAVAEFIVETRRAEYVHWAIMLVGPCYFIWSPPWLARTMTLFAIGFNLPFIAVQRFNRARAVRSHTTMLRVEATR